MSKPPVSYGNAVKLTRKADFSPEVKGGEIGRSAPAPEPPEPTTSARRSRPMESRSDPTILYLHPDGKYELKRYALARGSKVKVHDLLMEAIEEWAERHGVSAPFRVPSEKPRRMS
jgi:hypothetical protein